MANLTKKNSFSSLLAIIIALVALFAGVYAVMKVNANPEAGAYNPTITARCGIACSNVVCSTACEKVLGSGTTCQKACQRVSEIFNSNANKCVTDCTTAIANLPSVQCSNFCSIQNGISSSIGVGPCASLCKSVEIGVKTCTQACTGLDAITKRRCQIACPELVVTLP